MSEFSFISLKEKTNNNQKDVWWAWNHSRGNKLTKQMSINTCLHLGCIFEKDWVLISKIRICPLLDCLGCFLFRDPFLFLVLIIPYLLIYSFFIRETMQFIWFYVLTVPVCKGYILISMNTIWNLPNSPGTSVHIF